MKRTKGNAPIAALYGAPRLGLVKYTDNNYNKDFTQLYPLSELKVLHHKGN